MASKGTPMSPGTIGLHRQAAIDKYGADGGGVSVPSDPKGKVEWQKDVDDVLWNSQSLGSDNSGTTITNTGPEQKKLGTTLGS